MSDPRPLSETLDAESFMALAERIAPNADRDAALRRVEAGRRGVFSPYHGYLMAEVWGGFGPDGPIRGLVETLHINPERDMHGRWERVSDLREDQFRIVRAEATRAGGTPAAEIPERVWRYYFRKDFDALDFPPSNA